MGKRNSGRGRERSGINGGSARQRLVSDCKVLRRTGFSLLVFCGERIKTDRPKPVLLDSAPGNARSTAILPPLFLGSPSALTLDPLAAPESKASSLNNIFVYLKESIVEISLLMYMMCRSSNLIGFVWHGRLGHPLQAGANGPLKLRVRLFLPVLTQQATPAGYWSGDDAEKKAGTRFHDGCPCPGCIPRTDDSRHGLYFHGQDLVVPPRDYRFRP